MGGQGEDERGDGQESRGVGGVFFFLKPKTTYEVLRSLVGSEMCIRDRDLGYQIGPHGQS